MSAGREAGDFFNAAERLVVEMRQRAYTRVWEDRQVEGLGHAALFRDTLSASRSNTQSHFVAVVRQDQPERPGNLTWVTYSPTSHGPDAIDEALDVFTHSFVKIIGNGAGEFFAPPPPAAPIEIIEISGSTASATQRLAA
ncbi:MAG TPA: hypothetical protein VKQ34_02505 [Candidatus Saccharimonadales bacterium]|nr:hypothetical protein [Candidatus Saccharimonadales bacterium]